MLGKIKAGKIYCSRVSKYVPKVVLLYVIVLLTCCWAATHYWWVCSLLIHSYWNGGTFLPGTSVSRVGLLPELLVQCITTPTANASKLQYNLSLPLYQQADVVENNSLQIMTMCVSCFLWPSKRPGLAGKAKEVHMDTHIHMDPRKDTPVWQGSWKEDDSKKERSHCPDPMRIMACPHLIERGAIWNVPHDKGQRDRREYVDHCSIGFLCRAPKGQTTNEGHVMVAK